MAQAISDVVGWGLEHLSVYLLSRADNKLYILGQFGDGELSKLLIYFGLTLEFWMIFLNFFWLNNCIEYSWLYWMNILDFVLTWVLLIQWKNEFSKQIGQGIGKSCQID